MFEKDEIEYQNNRLVNLAVSVGTAALAGVETGVNIGLFKLNPALGVFSSMVGLPLIAMATGISIDRFDHFLHHTQTPDTASMD